MSSLVDSGRQVAVRPVLAPIVDLPGDVASAHKGHAHAVERIRGLEQQLAKAFEALYEARANLKDRAGVDAVTNFDEPMGAAWKVWLAAHEVGEMRTEPRTDDDLFDERALEAMRLVAKGAGEAPVPVGAWDAQA